MVNGPQRQAFGCPAVHAYGEGMPVAKEWLPVVAAEQDTALGREATQRQFAAQPGQPARGTADGRHQPDLAVLLVAPCIGQPFAAGRQAGRCGLGQAGRQPLRDAPGHWHAPEVVVADEDHPIALQAGLA